MTAPQYTQITEISDKTSEETHCWYENAHFYDKLVNNPVLYRYITFLPCQSFIEAPILLSATYLQA